jgi:hypothetical protein
MADPGWWNGIWDGVEFGCVAGIEVVVSYWGTTLETAEKLWLF